MARKFRKNCQAYLLESQPEQEQEPLEQVHWVPEEQVQGILNVFRWICKGFVGIVVKSEKIVKFWVKKKKKFKHDFGRFYTWNLAVYKKLKKQKRAVKSNSLDEPKVIFH